MSAPFFMTAYSAEIKGILQALEPGVIALLRPLLSVLYGLFICSSLSAQTANANELSRGHQVATLQKHVERYINRTLVTAPWSWDHPWEWTIFNFKIIGHGTFGNRDYVVGTCYWNNRESTVYSVAEKIHDGWGDCGYSIAPVKEPKGPIQWSGVVYPKQTVVIFGTVSDDEIKKVRIHFIKPSTTTEASVGADGFFLKAVPISEGRPKGTIVEGLDSSNRILVPVR